MRPRRFPFPCRTVRECFRGGQSVTIEVSVSDAEEIQSGEGNYRLIVQSGARFMHVPIVVEVIALPEISLSEPPDSLSSRPEIVPIDTLDFGRTEFRKEFWIANTGPRSSNLYFRVTHDDEGVDDPVIISVAPKWGDTNQNDGDFFYPSTENTLIDGTAVVVTVSRDNMEEEVELRTITIEAMDQDYSEVLSAVDAQTITVRVERPPLTVEGAMNRARPPYMKRLVFTLRDSFGSVIPTATAEQQARISFQVEEEGVALDLDETSMSVTYPEIRGNVVLMLDFTGSMLNLGVDDAVNPLDVGEALENMRSAAKSFIDDLPPNYRLALMYHHDRQQTDYVIHPFSDDKAALKEALDAFTMPALLHAVSNIRDAVGVGISLLASEDAGETLPFDDADFRGLVFITDGQDNASVLAESDVSGLAVDYGVRLFPVVYSTEADTDLSEMVAFAEESGGHFYAAASSDDLGQLFENDKGLAFRSSASSSTSSASFSVVNNGESAITWELEGQRDCAWIESVHPVSGTLAAGASVAVTVLVDATELSAGAVTEGDLTVNSNNGDGNVHVSVTTNTAGAVTDITLELEDELGQLWNDFTNPVVLTYVTPRQDGGPYLVRGQYIQDDGRILAGFYEKDGVFAPGDVDASQLTLVTEGLSAGRDSAVVYLRGDYMARNMHRFRLRFYLDVPSDLPEAIEDDVEALFATFDQEAMIAVELAEDGLLMDSANADASWRLLRSEDNVYDVLTEESNSLAYGAFGNLLKITVSGLQDYAALFDGVTRAPELLLKMRVDNEIYYSPASPGHPSETRYVSYPGSLTNPSRPLIITTEPALAAPALDVDDLAYPPLDPESTFAWDRDEDTLPDFLDPEPDNDNLPGPILVPNPAEIRDDTVTLTVRNNRLDRFSFDLTNVSDYAWITGVDIDTSGTALGDGTLLPGESASITLSVSRAGLLAGRQNATLVLETDHPVFGSEEVSLTLVVEAE